MVIHIFQSIGRRNFTDNCIETPNPSQADYDEDGYGDFCDNQHFYNDDPIAIEAYQDGVLVGIVRPYFSTEYTTPQDFYGYYTGDTPSSNLSVNHDFTDESRSDLFVYLDYNELNKHESIMYLGMIHDDPDFETGGSLDYQFSNIIINTRFETSNFFVVCGTFSCKNRDYNIF